MFFTVVSDAKRHILGQPQYNVTEFSEEKIREADRIYAEQQKMIAEVIHDDNKSTGIELILCVFFGALGVHKFYRKKIGMGILYLLTFGLFGIGVVIDTIAILIRLIKSN